MVHQHEVSILSLHETNYVALTHLHGLVTLCLKRCKLWQRFEASLFDVVQNSIIELFAILILTTCNQYLTFAEGSDKGVASRSHLLPSKLYLLPKLHLGAIYVLSSIESLDTS